MPDFAIPVQAFSDYEFCPRLAQLSMPGWKVSPPSWPVRQALKRYLLDGIRLLVSGVPASRVAADLMQAFLNEGSGRGYEYGNLAAGGIPVMAFDRNVYVLVQDYASWLEAAIYLVAEFSPVADLEPVDPVDVGNGRVIELACWRERSQPACGHAFRIFDRFPGEFDTYLPTWNELLAITDLTSLTTLTTHALCLPAAVKDRVPSPLCLAYAHPLTGHLRLATFNEEKVKFTAAWRRIARWQTANLGDGQVAWPEWRAGIERDRCLDKCYREVEAGVPDDRQKEGLLEDASRISRGITAERLAVKRREVCPRCYMKNWCHGDETEKESYRVTE